MSGFTHTLTMNWSNGATSLAMSVALTSGLELNIEESIANGQTDKLVACAIDVSQLKMIVIVSDAAVTLETNSGSAADDTFVLTANLPLIWYQGCGVAIADFLGADITALYVTNASGGAALVKVRALIDPTL